MTAAANSPAAPAAPTLLRGGTELLRHVFQQARRGAIGSLLFLLLGSIVESLSILLVIPLLMVFQSGKAAAIDLPLIGPVTFGFSLEAMLGGLLALVIAKAWFMRMRNIYTARVLIDLVNAARLQMMESLGRARWDFLAGQRTSDLNHLMTVEVDRLQGGAFNVLLLIQTVLLLGMFLVVSALISPAMTLAAGALGVVVLAVLTPVRRMAGRYGELKLINRRAQYATIGEFLAGLKLAKTFNAEATYAARLATVLAAMRREALGYARISSTSTVVSQVISAVAVAVIVLFGIRVVDLSLPYLVAFLLILLRSAPQFLALQTSLQELLTYLPAFRQVRDLQERAEAVREPQMAGHTISGPVSEVRFDNVEFGFPGQPESVLNGVSCTIPAGQITAIVGSSGAGKSTLADLLLGLQRPAAGQILIDGVALGEDNRRAWRDHTGYVSQDVFLMHDSIGANLALARPTATEAELWQALELAQAKAFVRRLPDGLSTIVGDRGTRLSGGERQRIALARALLRRPRLLVLDEATSALDWENQQAIARAIADLRGHLTVVTIAHRPSMIAFADRVIALDHGHVVEEGSYTELVRAPDSTLQQMFVGEDMAGTVSPFRKPVGRTDGLGQVRA